jgi:hypothetical protein
MKGQKKKAPRTRRRPAHRYKCYAVFGPLVLARSGSGKQRIFTKWEWQKLVP